MISIGLDLHVCNSVVTAIDGQNGEVVVEGVRVPNCREKLTEFFDGFSGWGAQVILEATTNTYPMVSLLRRERFRYEAA